VSDSFWELVRAGHTVDVGGAPVVVAGEESVEGGNAVAIGRLDATEGGAVEDGGIIGVAHAGVALDTDVDTLRSKVSISQFPQSRAVSLTVALELQMST
jgi:hypothetical protein